jgi:hypothetical protein
MTGIAGYSAGQMINWVLCGTGVQPTVHGIGLSLGAPTSASASEIGTGSGLSRATVVFATATAGTSSNNASVSFGPALSAATITGMVVFDTLAATAGNMLIFGNLATVRTLLSGDSLTIATGALTFSLA